VNRDPSDDNETIHVTAQDALHVVDHSTTFTGDVELRQGTRQINASFISLDAVSDIATMHGAVSIREPGILLRGDEATGNLFAGTGVIDTATFILHQSRMRGRATRIYKEENNQLLIQDGDFTRCDPDVNTWSVHGKSIRLKPDEGHGVARDVTLKIKDIPVAYFPYFRFPISEDRLSGFLMPAFGQDSSGGTDIVIPYYFNLAPQYDATYTFRSLWKRGLIHSGEFRLLSENSNNLINATFLKDDDIYDDRTNFDLSSGGTFPQFEKQDRWLLHSSHSGAWGDNWRTSLNYSAVSDNDYLHDIGGDVGSTAIDQATDQIDENLGNIKIPALTRDASITYRKEKWSTSLLVQGFQTLDLLSREEYEKLPELVVAYADDFQHLTLDMKVQYTYFDKNTDGIIGPLATTGQRAVTDVRVSAPIRNAWGYIIPSLGILHRKYDLNDEPLTARSSPEIATPSFSLDSGLIFDRPFSLMGHDFLQTLESRLYYLYVQFDEQDDLPRFDATPITPSYPQLFRNNRFAGYDRLGDANQISLGISTSFLFADTGAEFLRASIGQTYYFQDREVIFKPTLSEDPTVGSSPLFTELRMALGSAMSLTSSFEWEPREGRSNRGKLAFKYYPDNRRILNLTYSYTSPEVKSLFLPGQLRNSEESDVSFIWPIRGKWSAIGRWNFGWDENQTIESLFGVEYNDCCWRFRVVFRRFLKEPRFITVVVDDPDSPTGESTLIGLDHRAESGIFFEFQLKGLADLGGRLDRLLENSIPGYRTREDRMGL